MTIDDVLRALSGSAPGAFAIVGAVARNAWAPPRATTDLDLAVAADAPTLRSIETALTQLGYRRVREQQVDPADPVPDVLILRTDRPGLMQVDLLVAKTAFEAQALRHAVAIDLGDLRVPVVTPEDLVVCKLVAYRRRDQDDARTVLRTQIRAGTTEPTTRTPGTSSTGRTARSVASNRVRKSTRRRV